MRQMIAAAAALVLAGSLAAAQPSFSSEPTLTVRGQGRVEAPPDHANITVEVVTKGRTLEAATAAHRDRASRAITLLRDMRPDGIEIKGSVFRLDQDRPPPPPGTPPRNEPEYRAITSFDVKLTQVKGVDRAVTALASTGLFEVRHLRFGLEERNPAIAAARRNAVEDARERATTYAEAAGVRLGEIVRIDDTEARQPREFAADVALARNVQIVPPETLTVSASVTIAWRIDPTR
jgi:uncharacterized protein YggE